MTNTPRRKKLQNWQAGWPRLDYGLALAVAALFVIGLIMVYSTTFDWANQKYQQPAYFLLRQLAWGALGLMALIVIARMDYANWQRLSMPMMGIALGLLGLVLVFGSETFGAQRSLLGGSIQPSEFAKLAMVIYIADWLASKGDKVRDTSYGLIPFSVLMGIIAGLVILQPDFSTAILLVATATAMFFLAGAEIKQLLVGGAAMALTFGLLIMNSTHARDRVDLFVTTLSDSSQASYHVQQALIALGSGGILGRGLGTSRQKLGYLPVAHTDSVFAVLGEEMGLIGCLVIIGLFAFLAYRGFKIASQAPDVFGALLAAGVTCWVTFEALLNIAVVTGVAPFTGVSLPFLSYGGSALVSVLSGIGLVLSVSRGTSAAPARTRLGPTKAAPGRSILEQGHLGTVMDLRRGDGRPRLSRTRRRE
jgi:cell division protein FtsW